MWGLHDTNHAPCRGRGKFAGRTFCTVRSFLDPLTSKPLSAITSLVTWRYTLQAHSEGRESHLHISLKEYFPGRMLVGGRSSPRSDHPAPPLTPPTRSSAFASTPLITLHDDGRVKEVHART
jgi:hypothetical protein